MMVECFFERLEKDKNNASKYAIYSTKMRQIFP